MNMDREPKRESVHLPPIYEEFIGWHQIKARSLSLILEKYENEKDKKKIDNELASLNSDLSTCTKRSHWELGGREEWKVVYGRQTPHERQQIGRIVSGIDEIIETHIKITQDEICSLTKNESSIRSSILLLGNFLRTKGYLTRIIANSNEIPNPTKMYGLPLYQESENQEQEPLKLTFSLHIW